jgi:hypothetical protein
MRVLARTYIQSIVVLGIRVCIGQWDTLWEEAKYEWAYQQPNINWTNTRGIPKGLAYDGCASG